MYTNSILYDITIKKLKYVTATSRLYSLYLLILVPKSWNYYKFKLYTVWYFGFDAKKFSWIYGFNFFANKESNFELLKLNNTFLFYTNTPVLIWNWINTISVPVHEHHIIIVLFFRKLPERETSIVLTTSSTFCRIHTTNEFIDQKLSVFHLSYKAYNQNRCASVSIS